MSSYRDSYYQYQHYVASFHSLYNEWNLDEFPLNEEAGGRNGGGELNGSEHESEMAGRNKNKADGNTSHGGNADDQMFWDAFHDEDDWNIFKKAHLESNGVVTYNIVTNQNQCSNFRGAAGTNLGNDGMVNSSTEQVESISGSIFSLTRGATRTARQEYGIWRDFTSS